MQGNSSKSKDAKGTQPTAAAPTITIYEDWDEHNGEIWYKWRLEGDVAWHYKLTPYKQKPVVRFKQISQVEFDEYYGGKNA